MEEVDTTTGYTCEQVFSRLFTASLLLSAPCSTSSSSTSSSSSSSSSPSTTSHLPWPEPYEMDQDHFAVPIYGYITPFFVLVTMATNCLVCAVLVRKSMRSCTNLVLTSLAVSDTMTGLCPLPCFVHFYTLQNHRDYLSYDWCFIYFFLTDYLPTAFHTTSIWLTVLLATQRFLHVCHQAVAKRLCTVERTLKVIVGIYAAAMTTQLCRLVDGHFVPMSVQSVVDPERNVTACSYLYHPLVEAHINLYFGIFYWFRVLFVHIVPCMVLVVLNTALVQTITTAQRRRSRLLSNRAIRMQQLGTIETKKSIDAKNESKVDRRTRASIGLKIDSLVLSNPALRTFTIEEGSEVTEQRVDASNQTGSSLRRKRLPAPETREQTTSAKKTIGTITSGRQQERNSTTLMLVVVVGIFLLVELPLAVLFILNFVDNTWSLELLPKNGTHTATLFLNSLTIISYSCNFFVYCAMSNQFRSIFKDVLACRGSGNRFGSVDVSVALSRSRWKSEESKLIRSTFVGQASIQDECAPSTSDHRRGRSGGGQT